MRQNRLKYAPVLAANKGDTLASSLSSVPPKPAPYSKRYTKENEKASMPLDIVPTMKVIGMHVCVCTNL